MTALRPPASVRRPFIADAWDGAVARDLLEVLRQRSRAVHARGRIAETLYALALDLCGDDGRLPSAERQWLSEALSGPVSEAAQEAVDTLLRELAMTIGSAPAKVQHSLGATSSVSRIDFE